MIGRNLWYFINAPEVPGTTSGPNHALEIVRFLVLEKKMEK